MAESDDKNDNDLSWNSRDKDFNKKLKVNVPKKAEEGAKYADQTTIGSVKDSSSSLMSLLSKIDLKSIAAVINIIKTLTKDDKTKSQQTKAQQVDAIFALLGTIKR